MCLKKDSEQLEIVHRKSDKLTSRATKVPFDQRLAICHMEVPEVN